MVDPSRQKSTKPTLIESHERSVANDDAAAVRDLRPTQTGRGNPRPGDTLADKYRVERIIGEGGMGVVVEATHLQLGQRVALKFIISEVRDNDEILYRFEREARAAAQLEGQHVARVFDFGRLPGGAPYIVMEYLEGEDAAQLLDREGPLPVSKAVDIVLQACVGIAEAHAAGIVHRDLKPANLFLTRRKGYREVVKVLDFGISKLADKEEDRKLTGTRSTVGSPMYMSPEQVESVRRVDHQTDVWALGAVLYELLSGFPPFIAESVPKVYVKILHDELPPLSTYEITVPHELERVLRGALTKARADRYATVADLAFALAPFGSRQAAALATAVVRLIKTSALAHDRLPSVDTSIAPPPISDSDAERLSQHDPTLLDDTAPEATSPLASQPPETAGAKSRGGKRPALIGAALLGVLAIGSLTFALVPTAQEDAAPSEEAVQPVAAAPAPAEPAPDPEPESTAPESAQETASASETSEPTAPSAEQQPSVTPVASTTATPEVSAVPTATAKRVKFAASAAKPKTTSKATPTTDEKDPAQAASTNKRTFLRYRE